MAIFRRAGFANFGNLSPSNAFLRVSIFLQLRRVIIPAVNERLLMMLEYSLEKFPATLKLRDGTPVVVRPLGRRDEARLNKFLRLVPEEERLFIKQSLNDPLTIREWCRHPD